MRTIPVTVETCDIKNDDSYENGFKNEESYEDRELDTHPVTVRTLLVRGP